MMAGNCFSRVIELLPSANLFLMTDDWELHGCSMPGKFILLAFSYDGVDHVNCLSPCCVLCSPSDLQAPGLGEPGFPYVE